MMNKREIISDVSTQQLDQLSNIQPFNRQTTSGIQGIGGSLMKLNLAKIDDTEESTS